MRTLKKLLELQVSDYRHLSHAEKDILIAHFETEYDKWVEKYQPVMDEDGAGFIPVEDFERVKQLHAERKLWTRIDGEGALYLSNGIHLVNRLDYIETHVPYEEGEVIELHDGPPIELHWDGGDWEMFNNQ
jgi:hypothetical protein